MKTFNFRTGITDKLKTFTKTTVSLAFIVFPLFLGFLPNRPQIINMNFSAYTLTFNFIYGLTIFPLKGSFSKKIVVLTVGDALSFIWNSLHPIIFLTLYSGWGSDTLSRVFSLISPLVNAFWMVSIWCFGLSLTSPPKLEDKRF